MKTQGKFHRLVTLHLTLRAVLTTFHYFYFSKSDLVPYNPPQSSSAVPVTWNGVRISLNVDLMDNEVDLMYNEDSPEPEPAPRSAPRSSQKRKRQGDDESGPRKRPKTLAEKLLVGYMHIWRLWSEGLMEEVAEVFSRTVVQVRGPVE